VHDSRREEQQEESKGKGKSTVNETDAGAVEVQKKQVTRAGATAAFEKGARDVAAIIERTMLRLVNMRH
jgi:hypothetical protein